MRTSLFAILLASFIALPAFAQLGPAGVPGAPGLAPEPVSAPTAATPATPPAPPSPAKQPDEVPKVSAACAKAKDAQRCMERQEARRKAKAACKGKAGDEYKLCVKNHMAKKTK